MQGQVNTANERELIATETLTEVLTVVSSPPSFIIIHENKETLKHPEHRRTTRKVSPQSFSTK